MKRAFGSRRPSSYIILCLMIAGLFTQDLLATNGYFRHGYGTRYRGLGGAGTALSLSAMIAATNPAGIAWAGRRVDFNLALFNPNREYTISGAPSMFPGTFPLTPGTIESGSKYFPIPEIAASFSLPGVNHALALAIYGNGGMNTDYDTKTFDNPQLTFDAPTGVNLSQLFVSGTYAREIVPDHAIGISGIFVYQYFQAEGLFAFGGFSSDPNNLTNNGNASSTGFGARIGYMGKIMPTVSIGASYQTKMNMSEFTEYAGLFAEGGDFDIPATWNAGIAVEATPLITVVADVQQTMYSDVQSVGNPMDLINNSPMLPTGQPNANFIPLGGDGAWGFGWEDIMTYKLGVQLNVVPGTTLRAGFSTGDQPIPDSEVMFNILAPGVIQRHITFGLSKQVAPKITLNFGFMHALSKSVTGDNPLEAPGQQQIEIKMNQFEGEAGLTITL